MRHPRSTVLASQVPTSSLPGRAWRLAVMGLVQLLVHGAPTLASAQQVALKSKYEEGSQLVYRITSRQDLQMPMGMGSQRTNQTETVRWTVQSVAPNGDATIAVTTEHVRLEASGPGGNQIFDSGTDDAPSTPEAGIAAFMVGLTYSVVVGTDGTVKSVQGSEQFIEAMRASLPPEAAAMADQMFSEEFISSMIQQRIQVFPTDPVGPNDAWQDSFGTALPMFGTMTTNLTFVLDGVEQRDGRTVALISSTGEMDLGDILGPLAGFGEIDMDTEMTGAMTFDVDRGVTLSGTNTMDMVMTISVAGQSMDLSMTNMTRQELIEYIPGG